VQVRLNPAGRNPITDHLGEREGPPVTNTSSRGKIEKNAQRAIIVARFVDWSSENFCGDRNRGSIASVSGPRRVS
jgi:hypothetical protein